MNFNAGLFSDAHLGYSSGKRINHQGTNLRVLDGYKAINQTVDEMIENEVDFVVCAGDIFHMAHPDIRTIIETQEALRRLAEAGIPVYIIAGNHDATDIRAEIPASGVLNEPNNNIYSFTDPYTVVEVKPGINMHFLSHHAYTDQGETMEQIALIPDTINILVSHGSCYDTNMGMLLHCPQEPREVVIPEDVMSLNWDYTWLGHIHERGWISSKDGLTDTEGRKQFYGGSLTRRGFTDRPCKLDRGWSMWNIDTDSKVIEPTFFTVNQRPQIDCDKIDASSMSPSEVEEKLVTQLQSIYNEYKDSEGLIPDETAPIVRQTLVGLTPISFASINWSNCSKYSKHFLTHTLKRIDSAQDEAVELSEEEMLQSKNKDIMVAFDDWFDEIHPEDENKIEKREEVGEKAKNLLKKGQDLVLDDE